MTESKDAVNGSDVTLTIDHDVQWYVEKVLKESCTKYSSPWGVAVVQDTQTGDILALADSDEIEAGSDQAKMTVSRAVSETFEPGSIGKVFTMSGMIQLGLTRHRINSRCRTSLRRTGRPTAIRRPTAMSIGRWQAFSSNRRMSA